MEKEKDEAKDFFEGLRQQKVEKFLKVGFTQEQAELLVEELKTSNLGFGFF